MKKILLTVLVITLALCAGCNTSSRTVDDDVDDNPGLIVVGGTSDDNDKPDDNSNVNEDRPAITFIDGWPTHLLTPGFPEYPGGQPKHTLDGEFVYISIDDTDKNTLERYIDDLKAWGFRFDEQDSDGGYTGYAESWLILIGFSDTLGAATIMLSEYDSGSAGTAGWPTDWLPSNFPVYPGGQPEYEINEPYIFITIENTDKNAYEGYMDALKAWGFIFGEQNPDGFYMGVADGWQVIIDYADSKSQTQIVMGPMVD